MLEDIIRSYLYTQYNDDDNIRAFVTAYNTMAKNVYDWMRSANLPIFVGGYNVGDQLRWIARGIYGVKPPVLASGRQLVIGAFNTFTFNTVPFNTRKVINQSEQVVVSDDLFKRIMTWNFYKGDGFYFTIPWLKRRIMRFLTGVNGVDVVNDQHWSISVLFSGSGASVSIIKGFRKLLYTTHRRSIAGLTTRRQAFSSKVTSMSTHRCSSRLSTAACSTCRFISLLA